MRMSLTFTALILVAACGRPEDAADPIITSITGVVKDVSGPIANALVTTEPFVKQAFTNGQGIYSIEEGLTIGGTYRVTASKSGYVDNSVTISNIVEGENTVADILLEEEGPTLSLSTTSVLIGSSDSAAIFQIENSGIDTLTYSLSSPNGWVTSISPNAGSVTTTPAAITVSIDRGSLPSGTGNVSGTISVTSNGGGETVTLDVVR